VFDIMDLTVKVSVGYMLKVLKSQLVISEYKQEFNAIRHGDYKEFMNLVKTPIPFMIVYNQGCIKAEENNSNYDFDFEGLLKSQNGLFEFYNKCKLHYGYISDVAIPDELYHKLVVFEIALRMHANNHNLLNKSTRIDIIDVINLLGTYLKFSQSEINQIQEGRKFLNMVKHDKGQFSSWQKGIDEFKKAFLVLEKYKILVV